MPTQNVNHEAALSLLSDTQATNYHTYISFKSRLRESVRVVELIHCCPDANAQIRK
jgi:hypothetical protein